VFLVDNSKTSLNGDYVPNRLEAQQIAVDRLMRSFAKLCPESLFAFGTLAGKSCGVSASLTTDTARLFRSLHHISRDTQCNLDRAVRCAFLPLHLCDRSVSVRRVIAMVGSPTLITRASADSLARAASHEGVALDLIAFGPDVETHPLDYIVQRTGGGSHFVYCPVNAGILSDLVIGSNIGPGVPVNIDPEPELALAIKLSMDEDQDPELAEAIRASKNDRMSADDEDFMTAIKPSLEEIGKRGDAPDNPKKKDDEADIA
jgi:26S proteasome regulatory subunit N10